MSTKSLYVGNLPYRTTEEEIRELFEPFGPITEIRVIGDKGFAFVEIPKDNMDAAIEANNGKDLGGRPLTVNEARPRTERSDRGGGGGDRGGGGGGRSGGRGGFGGGGGGGGRRW